MNIIITGGYGFLGTNLAKRFLEKGHNVTIFDIKPYPINKKELDVLLKKIKFVKVDLTNLHNLEKIKIKKNSIILHCAGQPSAAVSFQKPYEDQKRNILSTINIINFARQNKASKIIFASTFNVYKEDFKNFRFNEKCTCEPKSLYATSKLAAENYLRIYSEYLGIKWNILRMFNIYGPGQDKKNKNLGMISIFLNMAKSNDEILVKGSLKRFRDFVFIDDVVDAWYKLALDKKNYNKIYNLGSGKKTTLKVLFHNISKVLNKKIKIHQTKGTPGDFLGCYADIKKIKKDLNFNPKTNLFNGIKIFNKWLDN